MNLYYAVEGHLLGYLTVSVASVGVMYRKWVRWLMDYYYYIRGVLGEDAWRLRQWQKTCLGLHILLQEESSKLAFGEVNTCDYCNPERHNESVKALCIAICKPDPST